MRNRVVIRDASADDAGTITAIYGHHVRHGTATFDTVAPTHDQTAAKVAEFVARCWPFLVAEIDSVLVGYAYASPFRDRPAYAFTCENSIYLAPEYTGHGLGKALGSALLPAAAAAGFRQMIAVIGGDEAASIALHAGLGFSHAGRLRSVGRKFERWLDTVYMQIALGAGDSQAPSGSGAGDPRGDA